MLLGAPCEGEPGRDALCQKLQLVGERGRQFAAKCGTKVIAPRQGIGESVTPRLRHRIHSIARPHRCLFKLTDQSVEGSALGVQRRPFLNERVGAAIGWRRNLFHPGPDFGKAL